MKEAKDNLMPHQTNHAVSMSELFLLYPELKSLTALIPGGVYELFQACVFNVHWGLVDFNQLDKHIETVTLYYFSSIEDAKISMVIKSDRKLFYKGINEINSMLWSVTSSICQHMYRMLGANRHQYQVIEAVRWVGENPILTIGTYDRQTNRPINVANHSANDNTGHQSIFQSCVQAARANAAACEFDPSLMVLEEYWGRNPESGNDVQS